MSRSILNGDYVVCLRKRIFGTYVFDIDFKDIVLFYSPTRKKKIFVKRIIGIPKDTIEIENGKLIRNSNEITELNEKILLSKHNPFLKDRYKTERTSQLVLFFKRNRLYFERSDSIWVYCFLDVHEKRLVEDSLSIRLSKARLPADYSRRNYYDSGPFIVPYKGMPLELDSLNALPENKNVPHMNVENNYYYVLGDNRIDSVDSRSFGFVSENDIIGKAIFVLFSIDDNRIRWNRICLVIN